MRAPSPTSPSVPSRLATALRFGTWALALVSVAACTEAKKKRAPAEPTSPVVLAPASAPASAASPTVAPAPAPAAAAAAPAVTPAAAQAPVPAGFDPAKATGHARLSFALPKPVRLGGFSLTMDYDAARFHVEEPVTTDAMKGYQCATNYKVPGKIRFNCAGLVGEDRGGKLATFDVAHAGAAPTAADFQVTGFEIVDDLAQAVPGVSPVIAVEPIAAR